jgi:hypothetical protein
VSAAALLLLLLVGTGGQAAGGPATIVGSAEVRVTGSEGRASGRIVFAAAAEPARLRLEVVQAGSVSAVVYCDRERLRVLVPGAPPLLHETEPTRAGFESALGLPFCGAELLFALRVGQAPAPSCAGLDPVAVTGRRGRVVGLRRDGAADRRPDLLRFSRFRAGPAGGWPTRAVLETEGAVATVLFGSLRPHDAAPLDLDELDASRARRVGAEELRRALGLEDRS